MLAILKNSDMKEFNEKLISWFRYLFWADICYKRVEKLLEASSSPEEIPTNIFIAHVSQWYGSLYVVVEGWQKLQLEDKFINELLNDHQDLIDLLRRYRNCVYHFQPKLLDNRIINFGKTKKNIHLWLEFLHRQFIRYFSDQLTKLPGNKKQKDDIKNELKELIGWIPENTYTDKINELNILLKKSELLLKEGNASAKSAKELRLAIEYAKLIIDKSKQNYQQNLDKNIKSINNIN